MGSELTIYYDPTSGYRFVAFHVCPPEWDLTPQEHARLRWWAEQGYDSLNPLTLALGAGGLSAAMGVATAATPTAEWGTGQQIGPYAWIIFAVVAAVFFAAAFALRRHQAGARRVLADLPVEQTVNLSTATAAERHEVDQLLARIPSTRSAHGSDEVAGQRREALAALWAAAIGARALVDARPVHVPYASLDPPPLRPPPPSIPAAPPTVQARWSAASAATASSWTSGAPSRPTRSPPWSTRRCST